MRSPHPRSGFSLVELAIALSITALIIVLLSQMVGSTTALWKHSQRKIDAYRDARTILLRMKAELEMALAIDGMPALCLADLYQQDDPAGAAGNDQAFLLLPSSNSGQSDVCAVGYFCQWDKKTGGYALRRYFADSDAVNRRARDLIEADDLRFLPSQIYPPADLLENSEVLGEFIWNLRFEVVNSDGSIRREYPLVCAAGRLPAALQVSFDAISARGASQLSGLEAEPAFWFLPDSHIYRRRLAPLKQHFSARISLEFSHQ